MGGEKYWFLCVENLVERCGRGKRDKNGGEGGEKGKGVGRGRGEVLFFYRYLLTHYGESAIAVCFWNSVRLYSVLASVRFGAARDEEQDEERKRFKARGTEGGEEKEEEADKRGVAAGR